MGYNIAGLPAYTSQQSKVFITRAILGASTIALLTKFGAFDPTAKGSEAIQLLDATVTIQDGSTCGRNPLGGATLTQAVLTVKELKINQNYCPKDLITTWAVEELKRTMAGLPYTDALFLEDIGKINSDKTAITLEKMIWIGDTTLTDVSLKQINGFLKQLATIGVYNSSTNVNGYINLNPAGDVGDGKINTYLRNAIPLMPIEVKNQDDFRVLMGEDFEERYLAELADKNLYRDPTQAGGTIWGTKYKYEAVPGLNGTNKIWAGRVSRLRAGGEMTAATFKKMWSVETEQMYFDSHFSLGVVPVYAMEMGLGDFTDV
jgi:hypothetical protein